VRRVLFTAPRFFGLEIEIAAELERRGWRVDYLPDRPFESPLMFAATRFLPKLVQGPANAVKLRMLEDFGATHYDAFLAVNGQTMSAKMMRTLRRQFPRMRTVLYMWDSMENRAKDPEELEQFDQCFSFDVASARRFGMRHRALFFGPGFAMPPPPRFTYDISFIGTMHSDRYAVLNQVKSALPPGLRAYWYLFIQAPWVYQAYRFLKPAMRSASRDEFRFEPLARRQVQTVFRESASVLDIEHPRQSGLTSRTLETIGARKKLLTTNRSVVDYDFYDHANICVIDRHRPEIPAGFFDSPYKNLPQAIYYKYSIAGWMDEVMGAENASAEQP
jgi:hypothetical protein